MPKLSRPEAKRVYQAAEQFRDRPLRTGASLFSDREDLWRGESLEEVYERYIVNVITSSGSFATKLEEQFDGASDGALQLMAEVLYVHFSVAMPQTIGGDKKREHIERLLGWMDEPVGIPKRLSNALDGGLAAAGTGFSTLRYWMVKYLVVFSAKWAELDGSEREVLLEDPWAFREFAFGFDVEKSYTQWHALIHLVFPDTFEPIISKRAKREIASHFDWSVDQPDANVDQKLAAARQQLEAEVGSFESFYDEHVRRRWQGESEQSESPESSPEELNRDRDVWIFQANPDRHDLSNWLEQAADGLRDDWSVTQYKEEISPGDTVLIWRSGAEAGLVAGGEIAGEPSPRSDKEKFLGHDDEYGVEFQVKTVLDEPILKSELKEDPILREMRIVKAPMGTNFRVERAEWRRLLAVYPSLAADLPVGASPEDVTLAAFFRRFFRDRDEAEWYFRFLEGLTDQLGAEGPGDERFALRIEGRSGTRLCLYFAERKMAAIRTVDYEGPRLQLTLDATVAEPLELSESFDWSGDPEGFDARFYEMTVEEGRDGRDDWDEAYRRGLEGARTQYEGWSRSPYRGESRHLQPIFAAIFDRDRRERLFLEGFEPGTVDVVSISELVDDLFVPESRFRDILGLLERRKNLILQGPPGVGKTFMAKRLAYGLMGQRADERIGMVQFHQSYTYEDFIQGYRPADDGGFERQNGVFYQFCRRAETDPEHDYVFIIDEINRGNLSKIFGELMMLVERDKRGPDYAMPLQYADSEQETFHIPKNVHLLGMMNTADRSLAMVDYALRRRFAFIDLEPAFGRPSFQSFLAEQGVSEELSVRINERMSALNGEIAGDERNLGPGFCIGHSYFCPRPDEEGADYDADWFRDVVHHDVEPLLGEYWFDDPERVDQQIAMLTDGLED